MIGFIALAGIIVRNSILLVDFIRHGATAGKTLREVLLQAGATRFPPILLTALAAMIGAATILSDPIFQGLAISLLFGLASSTLLRVLVIPAIYVWLRNAEKMTFASPPIGPRGSGITSASAFQLWKPPRRSRGLDRRFRTVKVADGMRRQPVEATEAPCQLCWSIVHGCLMCVSKPEPSVVIFEELLEIILESLTIRTEKVARGVRIVRRRMVWGVLRGVVLGAFLLVGQPAAAQSVVLSKAVETALQSNSPNFDLLRKFYAARQNRTAWFDDRGMNDDGRLVLAAIAASEEEGLDPFQYQVFNLAKPPSGANPSEVASRDLQLTIQVLHYASDLRGGRDTLKRVDKDVDLPPTGFDASTALSQALTDGKLPRFLGSLAPQSSTYRALKVALARYRNLAATGGWPPVVVIKPFNVKEASPEQLAALQSRLAFEDPTIVKHLPPLVADADAALRRYQARNGIIPDGVVGPATVSALNISASARVAQIAANMERLRWMPHGPERSYVTVNIPDASLIVVDNDTEILISRVIVGRPKDRTPMFRAQITDVVVNPPWIVPTKIARNEIFPKARKNPTYLASQNMVVRDGQIEQLPGPKNSLGLVKLNVTNRYSVYLHDTPSRTLFARNERFLSHGCIRVQQIAPLASYAMTGDITGGVERLMSEIATGQTVRLPIKAPLPLYVEYFTAYPSVDGVLQFRSDIYGRDARLIAAMAGATFAQATGSIGDCVKRG